MKYNTCLCKGKESVISSGRIWYYLWSQCKSWQVVLHDAYVGKFLTSFGIWRETYKKKDKRKEDYERGYKKTQACPLHPGTALISNNP